MKRPLWLLMILVASSALAQEKTPLPLDPLTTEEARAAERIVSQKDAVEVQTQPRGRSTIVRLQVAEEDMGKVIGKSGRNIEALRAVVRAAGLRHHERVQVELKDQR